MNSNSEVPGTNVLYCGLQINERKLGLFCWMMMGHSPELGWLGWLVKNTSTSNSHHNKASVQVGSRHKTCGASFKPQQPPEVSNALISFSGMRKLTSLDVKQIIPGHKVAKWQSQHLNPRIGLHLKAPVPTTMRISSNNLPGCGRRALSSLHPICFRKPPQGLHCTTPRAQAR